MVHACLYRIVVKSSLDLMQSVPPKSRESGFFKEVWIEMNRIKDYIREISPTQSGSQGVYVDRKSNGTAYRIIPSRQIAGNARVVRMLVTQVLDDKLICTNQEDGQSVSVAKPFNLRDTNWDGQSIQYTLEPYPNSQPTLTVAYGMITPSYRTATIGGYVEHQVIRPQYKVNFSQIFAAACDSTGVSGCDWVDINADGRAWTMVAS